MKKRSKLPAVFAAMVLIGLAGCAFANIFIIASTQSRVGEAGGDGPAQAILILGAKVYADGRVSHIVEDRINTAVDIYRAGQAGKILISGDHGTIEYDEVNTIRKKLEEAGVPDKDIFLDHAGFNTYDSLYRAKVVFGASSLIIVTQRFHLNRALFLADRFGIPARGAPADKRRYRDAATNEVREFCARTVAFFNAVIFRPAPRFLGPAIDLAGDGRVTFD